MAKGTVGFTTPTKEEADALNAQLKTLAERMGTGDKTSTLKAIIANSLGDATREQVTTDPYAGDREDVRQFASNVIDVVDGISDRALKREASIRREDQRKIDALMQEVAEAQAAVERAEAERDEAYAARDEAKARYDALLGAVERGEAAKAAARAARSQARGRTTRKTSRKPARTPAPPVPAETPKDGETAGK